MIRKTLVIFFVALICTFLIYKLTYKEKTNYLALGDELVLGYTPYGTYNKSYSDFFATHLNNNKKLGNFNKVSKYDKRIQDLINEMENARKINNKYNINQLIADADIITLSFGQKEFYDLLNSNYKEKLKNINDIYKYIDNYFNDYVILLNKIRMINNNEIYIIGLYNPLINTNQETIKILKEIFDYINKKFTALEENKKIYYIDITNGMDDKNYYIPSFKNPYPSLEGYNYIFNRLMCKVSKKH